MVLLSWHWLFFGQSQMERMVLWGSGAQEKDTERVGTKLKSHSSDWVQVSKSWWCHVALWPHEEFLKKKLRFGDTHKVSYGWSLEKKVWFETSLVWWSHPLNRALAFTPSGPFTVLTKGYPFEKSIKTSNEPLESISLWDSFSHHAGRKTKMKKIYFSLAFFKAFTTLALVAVASAAPQAIIEKFPLPCWISFNLSSSIALEITLLWSI